MNLRHFIGSADFFIPLKENSNVRGIKALSFMVLWFYSAALYLSCSLFDLFSSSQSVLVVYRFYFMGVFMGTLLAPLLLPVPRRVFLFPKLRLPLRLVLIGALFLPGLIIRFLGLEFWLSSLSCRIIAAVNSGMFIPLSYGLFFYSWQLHSPGSARWPNRTDPLCPFLFALALITTRSLREYSLLLLNHLNPQGNPLWTMGLLFQMIRFLIILTALSALVCVAMIALQQRKPEGILETPLRYTQNSQVKIMIMLWGLAGTFILHNALVGTSLFPSINFAGFRYLPLMDFSQGSEFRPQILSVFILVPILCLLAGQGINRFLKKFLPFCAVLFILLPCLSLISAFSLLFAVLNSLATIGHYTFWILFSLALLEYFRGSFSFYFCVSVIVLSGVFSFFGAWLLQMVPQDPGITVLMSCIFAAVFVLLSLKIMVYQSPSYGLIPLPPPAPPVPLLQVPGADLVLEPAPEIISKAGSETALENLHIDRIFKTCHLSKREIEVALLLIQGLSSGEIADRLFVSRATISFHLSNIYRKFGVKNRKSFFAYFVSIMGDTFKIN